jgi:hypothetical protein
MPAAEQIQVEVPRSRNQAARKANLEIRFSKVKLKAPAHKTKYLGLNTPLDLWLVEAKEAKPPEGVEAICWRVWTTVEISSSEQAKDAIGWYSKRWNIEEFHRILKTGCKVEERQLESFEKLSLVLVLDLIVASYLLGLTKAARARPEQPATEWLKTDQWQALYCYIHRTKDPTPATPTLSQAVNWIARLGGFLNRKGDGAPGAEVLWRGLRRLDDIAEAFRIFRNQEICG